MPKIFLKSTLLLELWSNFREISLKGLYHNKNFFLISGDAFFYKFTAFCLGFRGRKSNTRCLRDQISLILNFLTNRKERKIPKKRGEQQNFQSHSVKSLNISGNRFIFPFLSFASVVNING